jgi:hypothetical protein
MRHASTTNLNLLVKFNFIRNNRKIVPFAQIGYPFYNSTDISQGAFTNSANTAQKQPAFGPQSSLTSAGLILDLGTEIKISNSVNLVFITGVHKYSLAGDSFASDNFSKLSYGINVASPSKLDGVGFYQVTSGLKYYFGRAKVKRNF